MRRQRRLRLYVRYGKRQLRKPKFWRYITVGVALLLAMWGYMAYLMRSLEEANVNVRLATGGVLKAEMIQADTPQDLTLYEENGEKEELLDVVDDVKEMPVVELEKVKKAPEVSGNAQEEKEVRETLAVVEEAKDISEAVEQLEDENNVEENVTPEQKDNAQEKALDEKKDSFKGGCWRVQDFLSINMLVSGMSDFDKLKQVLEESWFDEGRVLFVEREETEIERKAVEQFLTNVVIYTNGDWADCKTKMELAISYVLSNREE